MDLDRAARRAVENGEAGAQLEVKDQELRRSLVRNFRTTLEDTLVKQLDEIRALRTTLKKTKSIVGASTAIASTSELCDARKKVYDEIIEALKRESWYDLKERVEAEEEA